MKNSYAMMVDLTDCQCLVVGGGRVAERKVASLLDAGACVTVVSPDITDGLQQLLIDWHERIYSSADSSADYDIVIAATNNSDVNYAVYADAMKYKQWINIVDRPDLCNFIVPASMKRGKLHIAVSTGGASPLLAKKIKKKLQEVYGEEYAMHLDKIERFRKDVLRDVHDIEARRKLMGDYIESIIGWY